MLFNVKGKHDFTKNCKAKNVFNLNIFTTLLCLQDKAKIH